MRNQTAKKLRNEVKQGGQYVSFETDYWFENEGTNYFTPFPAGIIKRGKTDLKKLFSSKYNRENLIPVHSYTARLKDSCFRKQYQEKKRAKENRL